MADTIQKNELESVKNILLPKNQLKFMLLFISTWEIVDFFLNFLRESEYSNFVEIINFYTPLVAILISITIFIKSFSNEKRIKQKVIKLLYPFVLGSFFFCLLHLFVKYIFPKSVLNYLIFRPDFVKLFSKTVENTTGGNFINPPGNYLSFSQITYIYYLPFLTFFQFFKAVNIVKKNGNISFYTLNAIIAFAACFLIIIPILTLLLIILALPNYSSAYFLFSAFMGGLTPVSIAMFLPSLLSVNIWSIEGSLT